VNTATRDMPACLRSYADACEAIGGVSTAGKLREAAAVIDHLLDVLHRDRSGLATALAAVVREAEGYEWVTQGRGPYAWDDDEYRKEMGRMLDGVLGIARQALTDSGDLAHRECCGRGQYALPFAGERNT
jgi:hypothetical protein